MKELLNQLAMKNGRTKPNSKSKAKLTAMANEALKAKLAQEAAKYHIHMKRDPSVGPNESGNVKFEGELVNNTSAEELENILMKLKFMGAKGERVFNLLKKQVNLNRDVAEPITTTPVSTITNDDPSSTPSPLPDRALREASSVEENLLRQKRELVMRTAMKHKELNEEEDENANLAIEEVAPVYLCQLHHSFNFMFFNLT